MKKKTRNLMLVGAIALVLVGLGVQQGYLPNPLAGFGGGGGLIPTSVEYVKAAGKVQYDNGTAIESVVVVLQYTNLEGKAVTLTQTTASDGTFTTGNAYVPEGVDMTIQCSLTNYHTRVYTSRVPVGDWSNRETAYLGEFVLFRAASGAATTSALIDQNGASISSSYNYTASGTSLTAKFTVSIATAGMRAGNDAYTDIQTGYSYTSSMVVFKTNSNLIIPESYDDIVQVGTTFYYIYNVQPFWNDPNTIGDGSVTYTYGLDIQLGSVNATDSCGFFFYQSVRADYVDNANFGTALEAIQNIDILV